MAINVAYRPNQNNDVARWLFFANLSHSKLPPEHRSNLAPDYNRWWQ
jgi:hypothetical protein